MGAQCLGKAAPLQGPLKRRGLKSFPASSAQQGSAKLQALIICPQNAAAFWGGEGGPEGGPEGEDISSRSALRPGDCHRAPAKLRLGFGCLIPANFPEKGETGSSKAALEKISAQVAG